MATLSSNSLAALGLASQNNPALSRMISSGGSGTATSSRNSQYGRLSSARQSILSFSGLPVIEPNFSKAGSNSSSPSMKVANSHVQTYNKSLNGPTQPHLGNAYGIGHQIQHPILDPMRQPAQVQHGIPNSSRHYDLSLELKSGKERATAAAQSSSADVEISQSDTSPTATGPGPQRPLPSLPPARTNRRESAPLSAISGSHDRPIGTNRPRYSTGGALLGPSPQKRIYPQFHPIAVLISWKEMYTPSLNCTLSYLCIRFHIKLPLKTCKYHLIMHQALLD